MAVVLYRFRKIGSLRPLEKPVKYRFMKKRGNTTSLVLVDESAFGII